MRAYRVKVASYDPEFPDCYFCEDWSSWSRVDWEDANEVFDQIVNNVIDGDGESWFNNKEQFVHYWILGTKPNYVDLPIRVTIEFWPEKNIYHADDLKAWSRFSGHKKFCLIKEAIIYSTKHHAMGIA